MPGDHTPTAALIDSQVNLGSRIRRHDPRHCGRVMRLSAAITGVELQHLSP